MKNILASNKNGDIMNTEQNKKGRPINCNCGKLVAVEYNGRVFVYCKRCRQQIEVRITEPRA